MMARKAAGDAVPAGDDGPEWPAPPRDFSVGDQVLAEFRGQIYKAKVNKIELENEEWKYFVHYQGWSTTWDEWLPMTRLKKPTRLNLKKMHDSNKSPNLEMDAAQNKPKPSNRKQTDKKGPVATHDKPKASDENTVKKEGFHATRAKTKASNDNKKKKEGIPATRAKKKTSNEKLTDKDGLLQSGNEVIKNERMPATRTKTKTSHDKRIKKEGLPVTRVKTKALNDNKIKKEGLHATSSKAKTATGNEVIKNERVPATRTKTKTSDGNEVIKNESVPATRTKAKTSHGNEVIKNERVPATRSKTKTSHENKIKKEGLPATRAKAKTLNDKRIKKEGLPVTRAKTKALNDNKIKKEGLHATRSKTKTATDCADKKIKKEELPAPSDGTKNSNGEKGKKLKHGSRGEEKNPGPLKKLVKIRFPSFLKKQLADDEEFITKHDMVVKLPRDPSVDEILKSYLEFIEKKHATTNEQDQVMNRGLTEHFNKALPRRLLYIQERQQYEEAIKAEKVSPSSIYGAEHLLRLFVQLPEILDGANMTAEALTQLEPSIRDFLEYLQANRQFFLSPMDKYRQAKGK